MPRDAYYFVLTQPETTMMRMMHNLITPKAFCKRRPHLRAQPWIRKAEVMQASPIAR